jgi:hypothetical protein
MKFEEVLPLMREGKRAILKSCSDDEWTVAFQFFTHSCNEPPNDKQLTLVQINPRDGSKLTDVYAWAIPRWAIMSDDWEIVE